MAGYAHISRCDDLSEDDIALAIDERRSTKALLDRLAKVSRGGEGAPRVLVLLARLAAREVDWLDGAMRVEVVASDGGGVTIDVLTELGFEMQERVVPSFKMAAPFREFARLVETDPRSVAPLLVAAKTAKRLALAVMSAARRASDPPPAVAIAEEALYRGSAKQRAAKRASQPEIEAEPPVRPRLRSRPGGSVRPPEPPPPSLTRGKTLRPEVYAVPPQPPHVPRAPRVPFKSKADRRKAGPG
jgi:hypothetical protein